MSVPCWASSSTSASPASTSSAIATATARFRLTTGDGVSCRSSSYSDQSVAATLGASAWQAAAHAILLLERDDVTHLVKAGVAARVV